VTEQPCFFKGNNRRMLKSWEIQNKRVEKARKSGGSSNRNRLPVVRRWLNKKTKKGKSNPGGGKRKRTNLKIFKKRHVKVSKLDTIENSKKNNHGGRESKVSPVTKVNVDVNFL